jgi:RNA polymerase sigma-70 factor (ECF subfamily)
LSDRSNLAAQRSGEVIAARADVHLKDAELVERALAGDRWAKEAIFRRYVRTIAATATRLLGNRDEAEDVVQDTFAAAYAELDRLRDRGALRGWLMQIAVRKMHRRFRRRRLLRLLGFTHVDDTTLAELACADATGDVRAELALIDRALARTPPEERLAWMLRNVEGESIEDVARLLGVSLATAKRRIKAAADRVARHLDEGGGA